MSAPSLQTHLSPTPTDREAITDTLYRTTLAFDLNDEALLRSALTADIIFELPNGPTTGLEAVIAGIFTHVAAMDTLHCLSNVRISLTDENTASVTCNAQAFHYRAGEGVKPDSERFVGGGIYWATAVRAEGGLWKFRHWRLQLMWTEGNRGIMEQ